MSTTRGIRTVVGIAAASTVILLGGCSSSGTTGSSALAGDSTKAVGTTGGSSGGTSSDSSSSSDASDATGGTTGGIAAGKDAGCQAAISDIAGSAQALSSAASNPGSGAAALKGIGDKLHADAGKSSGATAGAITKLGDDYTNLGPAMAALASGSGKAPDTSSLATDMAAMNQACGL